MSQAWKSVIVAVITAAVVGGGVYFWQQSKNTENKKTAPQETEKTVTKNTKIFKGNGFSFAYPSKYIADDKGLWTEEGYEWYLNPPETCSFCHIPYIAVKAEATNYGLEQYIIAKLQLLGKNLEEAAEQGGISYEQTKIGNNDRVKITTSEMVVTTGYYIKNKNTIVSLQIFGEGQDEEELKEIVGSLVFE